MRLAQIQRMVVRRPDANAKAILFLKIGSGNGGRNFIQALVGRIPSAAQEDAFAGPDGPVHLGLTWQGITKILSGHGLLDPSSGRTQLEPFFVDTGTAFSHPDELGFVGDSAPDRWWDSAWTDADLDLAVFVFAANEDDLSIQLTSLRELAGRHGLHTLDVPSFRFGTPSGATPAGGIMHFGFRDGITTPDIDWEGDGTGTVDRREIILGDWSADYPLAPYHDGPWKEFVREGSMACIAWIAQDAANFDRSLDESAAKIVGRVQDGSERDWIASRIMGRWPDGSPTIRHPDRAPSAPDLDDGFGFGDDLNGRRCPLNAHIRVVNARDDLLTSPNRLVFPRGVPRVIRRGFSYGPPYVRGGGDANVPRGLVGTFLCARVNEQFLKLLRWMRRTDFAEVFARAPWSTRQQDALIGAQGGTGTTTIWPTSRPINISLRQFITFRGVSIVFMPSLPSLRLLAGAQTMQSR